MITWWPAVREGGRIGEDGFNRLSTREFCYLAHVITKVVVGNTTIGGAIGDSLPKTLTFYI